MRGSGYGNYSVNRTALAILNAAKAAEFLPVVAVLSVIMVVGIVGNVLVCYIYRYKFKRTSANYFIVWLSVLDLISCCIGIPFEIVDIRQPYAFNLPNICKIMRFTSSSTVIASGLTLVAVACDRYCKIAQPLRRFPNRTAKLLNICSLVVALIFSVPALFVFGLNPVLLRVNNSTISGYECSVDGDMARTPFPLIYHGLLALLFVMCLISFIVTYGRLARKIMMRKNFVIGEGVSMHEPVRRKESDSDGVVMSSRESPAELIEQWRISGNDIARNDHYDDVIDNRAVEYAEKRASGIYDITSDVSNSDKWTNENDCIKTDNQSHIHRLIGHAVDCSNHQNIQTTKSKSKIKRKSQNNSRQIRFNRQRSLTGSIIIRTGRVTSIFICVSVVFVISFLPYVTVKILSKLMPTITASVAYNFATRSFFINSAANPLIYSFLNDNFRTQCCLLLRKLTRRR